MTNENLIHVKLEINESIEGKRQILYIKAELLKLIRTIQKYNFLRMQELKLKLKIYNKIKILKSEISKLQKTLPKIEIKELPSENRDRPNASKLREKLKSKKTDNSIDRELEEIQRKLRELGA